MTVPARCNYNAAALTTTTTAALYTILHPGVMGEATTATTAAALKKRYSNHLSVHQWIRSAVGIHNHRPLLSSYFWNFCHRLVRYYWYTFIHVYIYIYMCGRVIILLVNRQSFWHNTAIFHAHHIMLAAWRSSCRPGWGRCSCSETFVSSPWFQTESPGSHRRVAASPQSLVWPGFFRSHNLGVGTTTQVSKLLKIQLLFIKNIVLSADTSNRNNPEFSPSFFETSSSKGIVWLKSVL